MLKFLQPYFDLSTREKRGVWSLLILLFIALLLSRYLYLFQNPQKEWQEINLEDSVQVWVNQLEEERQYGAKRFKVNAVGGDQDIVNQQYKPNFFDPNTVNRDEFLKMGFSDKNCQSLMKWRTKGGRFYKKEDFKKLYFVSDDVYAVFENFIQLPSRSEDNKKYSTYKEEKKIQIADLNLADSAALEALPAIGPALARKIIQYRNRLGGYLNHTQLLEIKGIDSTNFSVIKKHTMVNAYSVEKININTAGVKDLSRHPYIGYNIALSLVNYRKNHGNYKTVSDIRGSLLINDENYSKISPYLKVN